MHQEVIHLLYTCFACRAWWTTEVYLEFITEAKIKVLTWSHGPRIYAHSVITSVHINSEMRSSGISSCDSLGDPSWDSIHWCISPCSNSLSHCSSSESCGSGNHHRLSSRPNDRSKDRRPSLYRGSLETQTFQVPGNDQKGRSVPFSCSFSARSNQSWKKELGSHELWALARYWAAGMALQHI